MSTQLLLFVLFSYLSPSLCQLQQCSSQTLLPVSNASRLEVAPTTTAGLEGWNIIPQSLIEMAWSAAGFPYIAFDSSQGGFTNYPAGAIPAITIVAVGIILGVASILCCCCICCCWCCCCCYDDNDDDLASKNGNCRSKLPWFIALLIFVIILLILTFVGAVIGLVAQSGVRTNVDNFPATVSNAATAYRDFIDDVTREVSSVFVGIPESSVTCLQNSSSDFVQELRQVIGSHSDLLTHADSLATALNGIDGHYVSALTLLSNISAAVTTLDVLRSGVVTGLQDLTGTGVPSGADFNSSLIDLMQVADTTGLNQGLGTASAALESEARTPINQFNSGFNKRLMEAFMTIDSVADEAATAANDSNSITSSLSFVRNIMNDLINTTDALFSGTLVPSQPLVTYATLSDIWYWLGIFFLILILASIILTIVGLIVGGIPYTCPKTPKRKKLAACGSKFMLVSIGSMLTYNLLLLVASAVTFFLGANLQELCEPLRDPTVFAETADNQDWRLSNLRVLLSSLTADNTDLENLLAASVEANVVFSQSLSQCEQNMPIWPAFRLNQLLNSPSLQSGVALQRVDIVASLNTVQARIDTTSERIMINGTLADVLADLSANVTAQPDLVLLSTLVNRTVVASYAANVSAQLGTARMATMLLMANLSALTPSSQSVIDDLQLVLTQLDQLSGLLMSLSDSNNQYSTLSSTASDTVTQYNQAKGNFNSTRSSSIQMAVEVAVNEILSPVLRYSDNVLNSLENEVGRCYPVWAGYASMRNNVCLDLVNYLNAFWFSLGWCAFWFFLMVIPIIVLGVLFQNPIEYSKDLKNRQQVELLQRRAGSWSYQQNNRLQMESAMQYPQPQIIVIGNQDTIQRASVILPGMDPTVVSKFGDHSTPVPPPFEKTKPIQDRSLPVIPDDNTYEDLTPFDKTKPGVTDRPLPSPWEQTGAAATTSSSAPVIPKPQLPSRELKEELSSSAPVVPKPQLPSRELKEELRDSSEEDYVVHSVNEGNKPQNSEAIESDYQPFSFDKPLDSEVHANAHAITSEDEPSVGTVTSKPASANNSRQQSQKSQTASVHSGTGAENSKPGSQNSGSSPPTSRTASISSETALVDSRTESEKSRTASEKSRTASKKSRTASEKSRTASEKSRAASRDSDSVPSEPSAEIQSSEPDPVLDTAASGSSDPQASETSSIGSGSGSNKGTMRRNDSSTANDLDLAEATLSFGNDSDSDS